MKCSLDVEHTPYGERLGVADMPDPNGDSSKQQKLSVTESLRRHWPWMLAVALFPAVAFLATEFLRVPNEVFTVFYLLILMPWWDFSRCRAPCALWIVAMGIWLASWFLMALLLPFGPGSAG